jgi:hypothetical protein
MWAYGAEPEWSARIGRGRGCGKDPRKALEAAADHAGHLASRHPELADFAAFVRARVSDLEFNCVEVAWASVDAAYLANAGKCLEAPSTLPDGTEVVQLSSLDLPVDKMIGLRVYHPPSQRGGVPTWCDASGLPSFDTGYIVDVFEDRDWPDLEPVRVRFVEAAASHRAGLHYAVTNVWVDRADLVRERAVVHYDGCGLWRVSRPALFEK